MTTEIIKW